MYSTSPSTIPNPADDDDRRRHGSETAVNNAPLPSISTRSPTHYLPYSPTNGTHPPSPYHGYSSRPSTSAAIPTLAGLSPRLGPPPSPKGPALTHGGATNMLRDTGASTYYDPLSEHREGPASRNSLSYASNSPVQVWYIENNPSGHPSPWIVETKLIAIGRLATHFRSPPFVSPKSPPKPIRPRQPLFFRRRRQLFHSHMRIHQADTTRSPTLRLNPSARRRSIAKATQARQNGSTAPWIVPHCETRAAGNRRARFARDRARSPGPRGHRIRWLSPASYRAMIHLSQQPVRCLPRDSFESP